MLIQPGAPNMSESSTPILNLDATQLAYLTQLKDAQQYPAMYLYLKAQVDVALQSEPETSARHEDLGTLSNWLSNAAAINANDGSFKSEFVRAAVDHYSLLENGYGVTNEKFQAESNYLALKVFEHVFSISGILSAKDIINEDVRVAVERLGLKDQWGWAGSLGDLLPRMLGGLGGDMVQVDTNLSLLSYLGELSEVVLTNITGGTYAATTASGYAIAEQLMRFIEVVGSKLAVLTNNASLIGGNEALISELQNLYNTAQQANVRRGDPLALDLDGDGVVETTALSKSTTTGTHFNLDAKGLSENTGWVSADDGLLVRDLNSDGQITSGRELFGNHTLLSNGQEASNGFLALKDLDTNADGVINAADQAFASLQVWKDADGDGVTDAGELLSLEQAGVASLKVAYTNSDYSPDAQGNQHLQLGNYTTTSGATRKMDDIWFATETARTQDHETVAVSDAIAALPDLAGMGNVRGWAVCG
jgi:hypothetical protein